MLWGKLAHFLLESLETMWILLEQATFKTKMHATSSSQRFGPLTKACPPRLILLSTPDTKFEIPAEAIHTSPQGQAPSPFLPLSLLHSRLRPLRPLQSSCRPIRACNATSSMHSRL